MDIKTKLCPHFTLEEFVTSQTAKSRNIDNTPPDAAIVNLVNLCVRVLEPLRVYFGKPVKITSGYRCEMLNKAVGGVTQSQHVKGEAADIYVPNETTAIVWAEFIKVNCLYDQLIIEHDRKGSWWLHVSCKLQKSLNRRNFIREMVKA